MMMLMRMMVTSVLLLVVMVMPVDDRTDGRSTMNVYQPSPPASIVLVYIVFTQRNITNLSSRLSLPACLTFFYVYHTDIIQIYMHHPIGQICHQLIQSSFTLP